MKMQPSLRALRAAVATVGTAMLLLALGPGFVSAVSAQISEDDVTVVVVPDTQKYLNGSSQQPLGVDTYLDQFEWIADNQVAENIIFTTHVGDVVQNPAVRSEWEDADQGFVLLDAVNASYGIAPGNHDMEPGGVSTLYDEFFDLDRYATQSAFGAAFADRGTQATWHTVEQPGFDLLFVQVPHAVATYGDPEPLYAAVKQVLADHPHHLAVITTHEFTMPAAPGTQAALTNPAFADALKESCTVGIVFSGHRFGMGSGTFTDDCGRQVHHVLTNFQGEPNTLSEGWLRTVSINPATLAAELNVWSPTLQQFRSGNDANLSLALAEPPPQRVEAQSTATCGVIGGKGVVTLDLVNPGRAEVVVTATLDGSLGRSVTLGPASSSRVQWTGRPDGDRAVVATFSGGAQQPSLEQTVAVQCDPEVRLVVSCLGGNGRLDVFIANRLGLTAAYVLRAAVGDRSAIVLDGDDHRFTITGRPDGTHPLVVRRANAEIWSDEALVACDPPVSVAATCLAENGLIAVTMVNAAHEATDYSVFVIGLSTRSVTVPAQSALTTRFSGRPDGSLAVIVSSSGQNLLSESVEVACDPQPTETTVAVSCLAGNGRVDVDLWNVATTTADFTVTIGTVAPRDRTVAGLAGDRVTATGRPDGPLMVLVEVEAADGSSTVVLSETVTVSCG